MKAAELHTPLEPSHPVEKRQKEHQRLRLVMLGRLEAWAPGGDRVEIKGRRGRAILALLGWYLDEEVSRNLICSLLWSRSLPAQQRDSLRHAIVELQTSLQVAGLGASLVKCSKDSISLSSDDVWVDVSDVRAGRFNRPDDLDLFRDRFLPDLEGVDRALSVWIEEQRRVLRKAAIPFAQRCLEQATHPAARAEAAQRWITIEPAAEHAWRELVHAEAARGDRAAALTAIKQYRVVLSGMVGATLPHDIEELSSALRNGTPITEIKSTTLPKQQRIGLGARLGVLPVRVIGTGLSDDLALSLAEEVSVALARFRWICVVDSMSLSASARANGEQAAFRQHKLNFVLSGTAQTQNSHLRLSVRLIDLDNDDGIVWSDRFDRTLDDLLALQDEIAAAIVARLDPQLLQVEAGRIGRCSPREPSAYDLLLRAIPGLHRLQQVEFVAAGDMLKQAVAIDRNYATAHAWLAYWFVLLIGQGWDKAAGVVEEAEGAAMRAVELDPADALGLTVLGHVQAYLHHRVDDGIELHQRALSCNPNLAMAWAFAGMSSSYAGDHLTALGQFDRYMTLAPAHPHDFFFRAGLTLPLLQLRRYDEAIRHSRQLIRMQPNLTFAYKVLLAALGHSSKADDADLIRKKLLQIEPDFDLDKARRRNPFNRREDADHYLSGLRFAGLC